MTCEPSWKSKPTLVSRGSGLGTERSKQCNDSLVPLGVEQEDVRKLGNLDVVAFVTDVVLGATKHPAALV